jgi:hypothetical protein
MIPDIGKEWASIWDNVIESHLNKTGIKYTRLHRGNAGEFYICLFVREDMKDLVSGIDSRPVKTIYAKQSKKSIGSILLNFKLGDTVFYMMNCKLFNEKENYQEQFNELRTIYYSCTGKSAEDIFQVTEVKFLFGDLNFRLELDQSSANKMIKEQKFEELKKYDQLWNQYRKLNYLPALIEQEIAFEPTSKYIKGTSEFDISKVTAWRDRILWLKSDSILCENYSSTNSITYSDHKPISGIYKVKINIKKEMDPNESLGFEKVEGEGAKFAASKEEIKTFFQKNTVLSPSRNMNALYFKDDSELKHITSSIDAERKGSYDVIKSSGI